MTINKKSLRGIRVFKDSLVDTFQVWGKVTRRSEEEAIIGCFGPGYKERNPVFNRPGRYQDRVSKTAWFEIETRPGVIRAFYTEWEFQEWMWDNQVKHGDRIMNRAEFDEMKRVFSLYDVPRTDRPAIYHASREYWHQKDMQRDFKLNHLRYEKEHGTLEERVEKFRAKKAQEKKDAAE